MSHKVVTKGTKTTTGGEVLEGLANITIGGQPVATVGMKASCNSGDKNCKGVGVIAQVGDNVLTLSNGQKAALAKYKILCGCNKNFICEPSHNVISHPSGINITIGEGVNVHISKDVNVTMGGETPHTNPQKYKNHELERRLAIYDKVMKEHAEKKAEARIKAEAEAEAATKTSQTPTINPDNGYWPPYDFTKPEGEKQIEVIYRSPTTKVAILAPEEWKRLFYLWDIKGDVKTVKDTLTGLYNARETAKALGGLGVTAVVREVEGVEYLFLSNYDKFKQSLLYGGVFRASNPQVVKMGLGALDSVKGMTRYVKVNAMTDFLVGSGINGLKYLLTDDYTLKELGVDEAKILVNAVAVAGVALVFSPMFGATVVGALSLLALSSFAVWAVDKLTDFEKNLIEAVIDEFDNESTKTSK